MAVWISVAVIVLLVAAKSRKNGGESKEKMTATVKKGEKDIWALVFIMERQKGLRLFRGKTEKALGYFAKRQK